MKKFFALMMAVCMLLSAAAFAEQGAVVQDEQPPMKVEEVNEAGETIIAKLRDAQGNVIAEISDDGGLILTDVRYRSTAADDAIVQRLTGAYEGVMGGVHYSEVESQLHEGTVKPDIDAAVAAMGKDAHDLVMYELYDVMLTGEDAALLADGSYLELTLELIAQESLPVVIMFTNDGNEWKLIDYTAEGGNRFTVKLTEAGTIALLADGTETMSIGEPVEAVEENEEPAEQPIVADKNSNFTPSVSGKEAPVIVGRIEKDGETYVGRFTSSSESDQEILVPDDNYIIVTSVAERDEVADIQTHEHLEWGYETVMQAEDVGELPADNHEGVIAADIDAVLSQMNLDLTHDQLVVKDLFEVTAYGDFVEPLYDDTHYLEVTFDAKLDPSKPLVVIRSADSVNWHVHAAEEVSLNADGTITLRLYDLGAVAFLVENEEPVNAETAVQSPN